MKLDATGFLDLLELADKLLAYTVLPVIDNLRPLPGLFDWRLRWGLFFTEIGLAGSLIERFAADLIVKLTLFLLTRLVNLIQGRLILSENFVEGG